MARQPKSIFPEDSNEYRLAMLTMVLLDRKHGLTKSEIFAALPQYVRKQQDAPDALDRMFERDKQAIEAMGVVIENIEDSFSDDNTVTTRYRIQPSNYELPAEISFSGTELQLLELAASVWQEQTLSDDARRALWKLKSLGSVPEEELSPIIGIAPKLRLYNYAYRNIELAIVHNKRIQFKYLKPGQLATENRVVDPAAVISNGADQLLYGYDLDRQAFRTFMLKRIIGSITEIADRETVLSDPDAEAANELESYYQQNTAKVTVAADTVAMSELYPEAIQVTDSTLTLHFTDLHDFAGRLASYGPELKVLSPAALVELVIKKLEATVTGHAK